jgi:hypothetical protein
MSVERDARTQRRGGSELSDSQDVWFYAAVVHIGIWWLFLQCGSTRLQKLVNENSCTQEETRMSYLILYSVAAPDYWQKMGGGLTWYNEAEGRQRGKIDEWKLAYTAGEQD